MDTASPRTAHSGQRWGHTRILGDGGWVPLFRWSDRSHTPRGTSSAALPSVGRGVGWMAIPASLSGWAPSEPGQLVDGCDQHVDASGEGFQRVPIRGASAVVVSTVPVHILAQSTNQRCANRARSSSLRSILAPPPPQDPGPISPVGTGCPGPDTTRLRLIVRGHRPARAQQPSKCPSPCVGGGRRLGQMTTQVSPSAPPRARATPLPSGQTRTAIRTQRRQRLRPCLRRENAVIRIKALFLPHDSEALA